MASALKQANVSADDAKLISRWLSASGYDDATVVNALKARMGIKPGQTIPYNVSFVRSLAQEVLQSGDAVAGKQVFLSSLANCTACHRAGENPSASGGFSQGAESGSGCLRFTNGTDH